MQSRTRSSDPPSKFTRGSGQECWKARIEKCLVYELAKRGLRRRKPDQLLPVFYDGITIDAGYRLDLRVEGLVIVEIKAVEKLLPVHKAQLLCYMRLSGCRVGLLINFNVVRLVDGITRMILD